MTLKTGGPFRLKISAQRWSLQCENRHNICEGDAHRGAMRRHKYEVALGEAREVVGCLALAEAKGLAVRPNGIDDHLDHVIGVLVKLTR